MKKINIFNNFSQKTSRYYIWQIICGLYITSKHFIVNLLGHILDIFGIKNKSFTITYEYPEKFRPPPERTRTLHYIKKRNDGSPRCVACMLCETVCPAYCINIIAKENSDPNIEKMPASFNIDLGRCIFCGFCVEACPLDAIHMDSGVFDFSAYSREKMILDLDSLLNPPKPIQPKNQ